MINFTHGALVFRIWRFDGSGELLAKFQYMKDAMNFAAHKALAETDTDADIFYLAACEHECAIKSYFPPQLEARLRKERDAK